MRILVVILAVLGIAISTVMAVLVYQENERRKETPEYKLAIALGEAAAKEDPVAKKIMDDHKLAQLKLYSLGGVPVLGVIGLLLLMNWHGLLAGLVFLVAGIGPYFIVKVPEIFVFTGAFILTGLLAFTVRRPRY